MSEFERQQVNTLLERLKEAPERLIVISGPRQVGKTTIIKQTLAHIKTGSAYFSTDEPETANSLLSFAQSEQTTAIALTRKRDTEWLTRKWEDAREQAIYSDNGFVLVLDEIQKIQQWSEAVKGLWDADRAANCPLHVVVLGSAPLLLQQGLTESLAGRFELVRVNHWSFIEMVDAFNFDLASYIYFGGYPGAARLISDQPRWREYIRSSLIEPNIEKDILMMTRVDKPALLRRVFELGNNYSGQILSYNKMVGQLQDAGNTTTLAHYLDLLSTAGLLTGLQKYAGHQHRRKASSPKLNVLNLSFMAVNSGYSFEEAQADRSFWGRMVESTVGAHLFNTGRPDIRLHYWRDSSYEVDFVLQKGNRLIGIEVKSTDQARNLRGMEKFREGFSPERALLVGGQGIPLEEFLTMPATHWFDSS
jgi:predicted AAA+ superfamily ATPase